ncbi:MAG: CDP-alcohol phosphatidyltransferase family protein [bacterium]
MEKGRREEKTEGTLEHTVMQRGGRNLVSYFQWFLFEPRGARGWFNIPNGLTILRLSLVPLLWVTLLSSGRFYRAMGLLIFIVGALTDYWDGKIARRRGQISAWGDFMDPLADKLLVLSALWLILITEKLGSYTPWAYGAAVVITFREVALTAGRMWKLTHGSSLVTSLWGKWKTAIQLITIISGLTFLVVRDFTFTSSDWQTFWREFDLPLLLTFLFGISAIITAVSGLLYVRDFKGAN